METLDIVDKQDTVVGEATRDECHSHKLRHRAVHIFLFDTEGQILLQQRSKEKDVYPGFLEASLSGHVIHGETYERAAIRELREEMGIEITRDKLKKESKFEIMHGPEHEFVQVFVATSDKKIKKSREETLKVQWITKDELMHEVMKEQKKFTPVCLAALQCFAGRQ